MAWAAVLAGSVGFNKGQGKGQGNGQKKKLGRQEGRKEVDYTGQLEQWETCLELFCSTIGVAC
jgi:hypothetical protein